MAQQTSAKLIVNAVGGTALAIVAGWIMYTSFGSDAVSVCEARYLSSVRFALADEAGSPLTTSEFQARAGSSEFGILDNTEIASDDTAPEGHALQVRLAQGTSSGYGDSASRGGVGFMWAPQDLQATSAACLSYSVYLPEKFSFSGPGVLPGLVVGQNFDARGEPSIGGGVVARPVWLKDGGSNVHLQFAGNDGWQNIAAGHSRKVWPRGRWVSVDEEFVLNTPGKKDGVVRLWVDGQLASENANLAVRQDENLQFAGVLADIHYGTVFNGSKAPEDTTLKLSSFVLRWQ